MRLSFLPFPKPQPPLPGICWERKKTERNTNHSNSFLEKATGLGDLAPGQPWEVNTENSYSQKGSFIPDSTQLTQVRPCPLHTGVVLSHWAPCLGGIRGRREASFWTMQKGGGRGRV